MNREMKTELGRLRGYLCKLTLRDLVHMTGIMADLLRSEFEATEIAMLRLERFGLSPDIEGNYESVHMALAAKARRRALVKSLWELTRCLGNLFSAARSETGTNDLETFERHWPAQK